MASKYPFLDLAGADRPYADAMQAAATRVLASGRYVGGPEVEAFERELADSVGTRHAVGVANGLDALRLILRAWIELGRLQPGDQVIVPANTYIASVLAVTDCGLVPVPVEPDPVTMNLDSTRIEAALTPRTRAVMPVHLYGRACHDAALTDTALRHSLLVIEDNAQAIGARSPLTGAATGALGHAAAFSFYPTKNIGAAGDAGAVTTDDAELAATVRALANYGSDRRYHNIYAGLNSRLDPVQAAILRVKLADLPGVCSRRQAMAEAYNRCIDTPAVIKPLYTDDGSMVWHQYVVRVADRDAFRNFLASEGVDTDVHYATPPHRQPCYAELLGALSLPVTEQLAAEVVSLPVGSHLTTADAEAIAAVINRYKPLK